MNFEFKGTSREIETAGIMLNGEPLDQLTINSLGKHKLIEHIGDGQKPARGKTPKLYLIQNRPGMSFTWTIKKA